MVRELQSLDLRVREADKAGPFVVLEPSVYLKQAVQNSFLRKRSDQPIELKEKVCVVLAKNNLVSEKLNIEKASEGYLDLFFEVKTHKPDNPFRCVVSGKGAWQ